MPTSFYVKTPRYTRSTMVTNALYAFDWYILSGVAIVNGGCLLLSAFRTRARDAWNSHLRVLWPVYAGLGIGLIYALSTATKHMFYSFRMLVPFTVLAAYLSGDVLVRLRRANREYREPSDRGLLVLVGLLFVLQAGNFCQMWRDNLSGARNGEFRYTSARDMDEFVEMYREPADVIREHWRKQKESTERPMRLYTFAAGFLPFELKEAYVYERLSAYRHAADQRVREMMRSADYICILSPWQGEVDSILPGPAGRFERIFAESGRLEGKNENYLVYYNPDPSPHVLPPRVWGE